jgi:hypothetical protein
VDCLAPRRENFGGHGRVAKNLKEGGFGLGTERAQRKRLGIIGLKPILTVAGIFLSQGFPPLHSVPAEKPEHPFVAVCVFSAMAFPFFLNKMKNLRIRNAI